MKYKNKENKMINQHKINMAIDERIDRVYNELNKRLDKLQDNNIYLDKKIRELEAQERALTKVVEMNADDINDIEGEQRIFFTKYKMLESQLKSTIGDKNND